MPRKPSCSCGQCPRCVRRIKKQGYGRARYERLKDDPEFLARKRAANRVTMERIRRARGEKERPPPLTEEEKAQRIAARRLARKLARPGACSLCASTENIEAHHPDYANPLTVTWLCRPCHKKVTWR